MPTVRKIEKHEYYASSGQIISNKDEVATSIDLLIRKELLLRRLNASHKRSVRRLKRRLSSLGIDIREQEILRVIDIATNYREITHNTDQSIRNFLIHAGIELEDKA